MHRCLAKGDFNKTRLFGRYAMTVSRYLLKKREELPALLTLAGAGVKTVP